MSALSFMNKSEISYEEMKRYDYIKSGVKSMFEKTRDIQKVAEKYDITTKEAWSLIMR